MKQVVTRRPSSASPGSRRWEEAVAANERAWAVSQERIRSKGLGVGQGDFHSYFWLHYGYLQQGRYREARVMLETVEAASKAADPGRLGSYYGRMRAQQWIESRHWKAGLTAAGGSFPEHFGEGLAALYQGRLGLAERQLEAMDPQGEGAAIMKEELAALLSLKRGKRAQALRRLSEAAAREDAMPLSYGPPVPSKPAHELLGEVLLETGAATEASREFQKALLRAPRRALSLLGLARASRRAGDRQRAASAYASLRQIWKQADPEVAALLNQEWPAATAGESQ